MNFGTFCHVEIPGTDTDKLKKFFTKLFGWKFESSMPGYDTYRTGDENSIGGGLWTPPEGVPRAIVNYILVPSVDEHSKKIEAAGGQIYKPKTEVPGMGWFAVFGDPEGNMWGIWETDPKFMQENMDKAKAKQKPAKRPAKRSAKPVPKKDKHSRQVAKATAKAKKKPAPKAVKKAAKPAKKKGKR